LPNHIAKPPRSVVSRLAAILLTFRSGGSYSITEIARLTGLPVSTTHRLTGELASWQLLRRAPDGRYEVGVNLQRLDYEVGRAPDLYDRAPLVVADLSAITGRRARLGVLRGGRVAYTEKQVGPDPATPFSARAALPAHATAMGKALLAFSPRETVALVQQQLTVYTAHTLTSPSQLHGELQAARLSHIATACGELTSGDCAVAVPVFGPGGTVVAALELQVHDLPADVAVCRSTLAVAARGLSRELSLIGGPSAGSYLRLVPKLHADLGVPVGVVPAREAAVT
jgi:DNA-binding IclR family transcriptional regulator